MACLLCLCSSMGPYSRAAALADTSKEEVFLMWVSKGRGSHADLITPFFEGQNYKWGKIPYTYMYQGKQVRSTREGPEAPTQSPEDALPYPLLVLKDARASHVELTRQRKKAKGVIIDFSPETQMKQMTNNYTVLPRGWDSGLQRFEQYYNCLFPKGTATISEQKLQQIAETVYLVNWSLYGRPCHCDWCETHCEKECKEEAFCEKSCCTCAITAERCECKDGDSTILWKYIALLPPKVQEFYNLIPKSQILSCPFMDIVDDPTGDDNHDFGRRARTHMKAKMEAGRDTPALQDLLPHWQQPAAMPSPIVPHGTAAPGTATQSQQPRQPGHVPSATVSPQGSPAGRQGVVDTHLSHSPTGQAKRQQLEDPNPAQREGNKEGNETTTTTSTMPSGGVVVLGVVVVGSVVGGFFFFTRKKKTKGAVL